jgi:hypothetical protein
VRNSAYSSALGRFSETRIDIGQSTPTNPARLPYPRGPAAGRPLTYRNNVAPQPSMHLKEEGWLEPTRPGPSKPAAAARKLLVSG